MLFNGRNIDVLEWKGEQLGSLFACDTETTYTPLYITPQLCTVQVYDGKDKAYYVPLDRLRLFFNKHYDSTIIFHFAAFDLDVLSTVLGTSFAFDLIDRGKVMDTSILYRLYHLATIGYVPFKYNLALLSEKLLNVELDKDNEVRLTFEQFLGVPIKDIPAKWLDYGAKDAVATFDIFLALKARISGLDDKNTLLSHNIQVKGDLALFHIHKNGISFNLKERDVWLKDMNKKLEAESDILCSWGWVRGLKGLQDRYEQIIKLLGIDKLLPRTKDGQISSKSDDLQPYRDLFPFVESYLRFHELEKATSFVRDLTESRVHPRYNLIVNTGRTSCSKPNFQQLPKLGGVREMFGASAGNTLLITDYSAIELATLSQVTYDMYGQSNMRDKINEGQDLHRYYASVMYSTEPSKVSKGQRQEAKAANFGFPGGLGIDTFIQFSAGYGLNLTTDVAQTMKNTWFQAFPEMRPYMQNEVGHVFTRTGRRRANTSYCAEKNTPFQGLAADGAKLALYELDKAGFRVVGFVHDEVITEVPEGSAEDLRKTQEDIMIKAMKQVVPDVKIGVESMISKVYTK
jgi:DNA polymerase I-like protein with 3'-5' exonuclease and polymerase domains